MVNFKILDEVEVPMDYDKSLTFSWREGLPDVFYKHGSCYFKETPRCTIIDIKEYEGVTYYLVGCNTVRPVILPYTADKLKLIRHKSEYIKILW